jgi:hypothetical protein
MHTVHSDRGVVARRCGTAAGRAGTPGAWGRARKTSISFLLLHVSQSILQTICRSIVFGVMTEPDTFGAIHSGTPFNQMGRVTKWWRSSCGSSRRIMQAETPPRPSLTTLGLAERAGGDSEAVTAVMGPSATIPRCALAVAEA